MSGQAIPPISQSKVSTVVLPSHSSLPGLAQLAEPLALWYLCAKTRSTGVCTAAISAHQHQRAPPLTVQSCAVDVGDRRAAVTQQELPVAPASVAGLLMLGLLVIRRRPREQVTEPGVPSGVIILSTPTAEAGPSSSSCSSELDHPPSPSCSSLESGTTKLSSRSSSEGLQASSGGQPHSAAPRGQGRVGSFL